MPIAVSTFPFAREIAWEELPVLPGTSPFHIKGTAYRNTIDRHARMPGGKERVRSFLPNKHLERFYDQPFVVGGWYDVLPMVSVDAAAAKAQGLSFEESLRIGTRNQASEVLQGVYRPLLRLFSPGTLAWALPRITATYYDFGEVKTQRSGDDGVDATLSGIPLPLADWYAICSGEFVLCALSLLGAKAPSIRWNAPKRDGVRAAVPTVRLEFSLRWAV